MHRYASTIAIAACAGAAFAQTGDPVPQGAPNVPAFEPAFTNQTRAPQDKTDLELRTEAFATGLAHPWGIVRLPDAGGYLVTERPGRLRHVAADGTVSDPIDGVPEVLNEKQGGLLDVALGPDFDETRMVYMTYAKPMGDGMSATAAARGVLSGDHTSLSGVEDIFVQKPASPSPMHYGSRVVFDGEGHAFVTTGEHFTEDQRVYAQDMDKTYGKVIRINLDGTVPEDNPFFGAEGAVDSIWSLGHRNIQGAAIRPATGQLWAIEHGPQGGDELNLVEAGQNYGWPVVSYGENYDGTPVGTGSSDHVSLGFTEPRYYWDPVIAPGGMIFYEGDMFPDWQGDLLASGLVAKALVRLELDDVTVVGEERLAEGIGRVRDVEEAPDGSLLLLIDAAEGSIQRLATDGAMN